MTYLYYLLVGSSMIVVAGVAAYLWQAVKIGAFLGLVSTASLVYAGVAYGHDRSLGRVVIYLVCFAVLVMAGDEFWQIRAQRRIGPRP